METLLLEIGTEEIPAGYIEPALNVLTSTLLQKMTDARIKHGSAKIFATPRRLAVEVKKVADKQKSVTSEILGPPEKIGFNKNPFSIFFSQRIKHKIKTGNQHEIDRNQRLVQTITNNTSFPLKLYPSQKDAARMSQYKTVKYITVSPASLWFTKQFPKVKWIDFISKLDKEIVVYFLGSKKDYEICNEVIKTSGHTNALNLAGKLSFLESAELMKSATMNFMNDSAPMHLASSIDAPTTAIFCSTVTSFGFGPLSADAVVVESNEKLDCRPCGLHGHRACPKKHFKCAENININELLARIN